MKTVIPPAATAKLSTRLVPRQDPHEIFEIVQNSITARHPDVVVRLEVAARPYLADVSGPYAKAAESATSFAFHTKPAFVREGGARGAIITMHEQLDVPLMMLGLSLPSHGYHAPDEHFDWQAVDGVKMFVKYFEEISKYPSLSNQLTYRFLSELTIVSFDANHGAGTRACTTTEVPSRPSGSGLLAARGHEPH